MKKLLWIIPLLIGCSFPKEASEYQILFDYEGKYEYLNNTTLELKASALDSILYAVIDEAKYPLNFIALDSFTDMQGNFVVFERNEHHKVIDYKADGQTKLIKVICFQEKNFSILLKVTTMHNQK